MRIEVVVNEGLFHKFLKNIVSTLSYKAEFGMKNEDPAAAAVEYGTGLYREDGGARKVITPRTAKVLIIPITPRFLKRYGSNPNKPMSKFKRFKWGSKSKNKSSGGSTKRETFRSKFLSEFKQIAKLTKNLIRSKKKLSRADNSIEAEARNNSVKYINIFLKVKRTHPDAIGFIFRPYVRGQKPQRIVRETAKLIENILVEAFTRFLQSDGSRKEFAKFVNIGGFAWLDRIKKFSPMYTGSLKSSWKAFKLAK